MSEAKAPMSALSSGSPLEIENMSFNTNTSLWPGYRSIKNLFVFGDSYSAIGFAANLPPPKKVDRNSVPFKGLTYADHDGTNWVGHLLMHHDPHPDILVYDYAVNENFLSGHAMTRGPEGLPWSPTDSLFVTWIGINDCAYARTHTETIELLFSLEEKLYEAGARIFMFIDVPPIGRMPAGNETGINASSDISPTYINWNSELRQSVENFASAHQDARILTFSAFQAFSEVLDNPKTYGLRQKDTVSAGGAVWRDKLHPTSKVHEIVADKVVAFLKSMDTTVIT
ncbi:hypothetical protein B0H10DRAFT_2083248 [Mycena sp. CBHHK59/15]|nr:hypothetical protein B0H10DRAFT_2083248 [Mycena sp. CBHHK59/15]